MSSDMLSFSGQVRHFQTHPFQMLAFLFFQTCTAMIGYAWHHSIFWSIVDFFFPIIAWIKWLICNDVNLTIIKSAFAFFFN